MKKIFLLAALLISGAIVNAQDFKPAAKSVTTDFGIDGGLGEADFDLLNSQLRFRYFQKSDFAYRLGVEFEKNADTRKAFGSNNEEGTYKHINNYTGINFGVEKHFKGSNRLSPYVGADLILGTSNEKYEYKNYNSNNGSYLLNATSIEDRKASTIFGIKALIGADYYIAKHLFLGVEAGIRFEHYKAGKIEYTDNSGTTIVEPSNYNSSYLNNHMFSRIRIGFVF